MMAQRGQEHFGDVGMREPSRDNTPSAKRCRGRWEWPTADGGGIVPVEGGEDGAGTTMPPRALFGQMRRLHVAIARPGTSRLISTHTGRTRHHRIVDPVWTLSGPRLACRAAK